MTVQVISEFESRLLRIVHGLFGHAPWEQVKPLLLERVPRPERLSPAAVRLIEDTLAKGCVLHLARGGWRRERFLAGDAVASGRLWERFLTAELALGFSRNALDFLMWCTATSLAGANARWTPDRRHPLTIGDRLLLYLAYAAVRHTTAADVLRRQTAVASHGLCRLAFPEDFTEAAAPADFDVWMHSPGAAVLEALQHELAICWLDLEQRKASVRSPVVMRDVGRAQAETLAAFCAAADQAGRRDQVRFLLAVAGRLLGGGAAPRQWTQSLETDELRLAERLEVYRAALAVPHMLLSLEAWQREALGVGYTDEGYAAAQLWKSDWERFDGDRLCRRARHLVRTCEVLR